MKKGFYKISLIALAILGLVSGVFATTPATHANEQESQIIIEIEPLCQPASLPHYRVNANSTALRTTPGASAPISQPLLSANTELGRLSGQRVVNNQTWIEFRVLSGSTPRNGWLRADQARRMGGNISFCW